MARKSLDAWIHEVIADNQHDGKISRIVLSHMVGLGRTEVHTQKFTSTSLADPKVLATVFIGKADAFCQDMRGEHRFMLDAYYGKDAEPKAIQPFTRNGQVEARGGLSEPPTEEGQLAQKMRWNGEFLSQVFRRQERQDAREDRAAERMEQERQFFYQTRHILMEENMKFFNMLKELMVTATLDTHKQNMERQAFERGTQREKMLVEALPIITNMVTGKEVFPQSHVDSKILEGIVKKLTPETIGMLSMLGLSEEEQAVIMHRFNQIKEKQLQEEDHKNRLPRSSMSGDDELTPKGDPH